MTNEHILYYRFHPSEKITIFLTESVTNIIY